MTDESSAAPELPAALQKKLAAAGVTDEAGLRAALEADPELAAEFAEFFQTHEEALQAASMLNLLTAFARADSEEALVDLWRSVPAGAEEPLMQAVEELIGQAEQADETETAAALRTRLDAFRQVHERAQVGNQLLPMDRAVMAFIQAPDEATAEAIFNQQRTFLQPYRAQEILDVLVAELTTELPAEMQARFQERQALLRRLRGAAPQPEEPPPPRPTQHIAGDLHQAGRDQYINSAHAEAGGTATVINNTFIQSLERRWTPPALPTRSGDTVRRAGKLEEIRQVLAQRGAAAVTGESVKLAPSVQLAPTVGVRGMAGVGKTVLAREAANELAADYSDGVLWQEIGPEFISPEQARPILREWAGYAVNFSGLEENLQQIFQSQPNAVRALLNEHPRLLVVLDNVWNLAAIRPLRDALPSGAHLIITTRSREVARTLGGGEVQVGGLTQAEALALCRARLGWEPDARKGEDAWLFTLLEKLERHALGLSVALGALRRAGESLGEWRAEAERLLAAMEQGDLRDLYEGHIYGDPDAVEQNVQRVLLFSYQALRAEEQRVFRSLGAFAPDAPFTQAMAAQVWGNEPDAARRSLRILADGELVQRPVTEETPDGEGIPPAPPSAPDPAWRQHGLLRSLALGLLRRAGETDQTAAAHARAYAQAMQAAEDEQRYYQMLPALPQLDHAFDWALANDLSLALNVAANCANLHKQFGLVRQAGIWSEKLLAAAQARREDAATLARAWGHRATLLSAIAALPDEDRGERLLQALDAYDQALIYRTLEAAPLAYAMTQGNLANLYAELAELPGQEVHARQRESVRAVITALHFFVRTNHAPYIAQAQRLALGLRRRFGAEQFVQLWQELAPGEMPAWLLEEEAEEEVNPLAALIQAFVQVQSDEEMIAFWQRVPAEMEEPFIQAVETLIVQANEAGEEEIATVLGGRLSSFQIVRQGAAASMSAGQALQPLLEAYQARLQEADRENPRIAAWQAVVAAGEALLAQADEPSPFGELFARVRDQLAVDYNTLGNAHDHGGDPAAALAAFERAIALQPGFAMWQRNRADALIDLGRLDDAAAAIAHARALEPDAPRLAELDAALRQARGGSG